MERSEYEKLDIAEDRMWWFAAMHKNLLLLARRVPVATATCPSLMRAAGLADFSHDWRRNIAAKRSSGSNSTVMLARARPRKPCSPSARDR